MVKYLVEFVLAALVGLTLITQVVIPMFIPNLEMFWLFKTDKKKVQPKIGTLQDLDDKVDETMKRYNEVEDEVKKASTAMNQIKSKINKQKNP